ncbi:MAG: hypothetical protein SFY96_12645, partial [Planctomycetota bacterium]|nr:hypothetical protein [Planctomycetota bacterium]
RSHAAVVLVALSGAAAQADVLNFRDWLNAHPSTPNATSNEWFGTAGLGGGLMSSDSTQWYTPGQPFSTPLMAYRTAVGSDNGAAGPATFDGSWVHPGSGIPAVLVFAPTVSTWVGAMNVRSELIANGLSGNGITITVYATIAGNTTSLGTTTLTGTDARLDTFNLSSLTLLNPGDRLSIAFGDNGTYLYDHVNFNAWVTIPAPSAALAVGVLGVIAPRRRG